MTFLQTDVLMTVSFYIFSDIHGNDILPFSFLEMTRPRSRMIGDDAFCVEPVAAPCRRQC